MATLRQIVDALDNFVESASGLQITCIKGYPDFRQLNLDPPIAALFYGGSAAGQAIPGAIGRGQKSLVLTLGVYGSDEVNLFSLMEKLGTMRKIRPLKLTAGSGGSAQEVRAFVGDDERVPPDVEDPKELRHFVQCPVVLVYE